MRFLDVFNHSASNLTRHKMRTFLTLAGVGLGVATLTILVSLGAGIERLVEQYFNQAELLTRITVLPDPSGGPPGRRFGGTAGSEDDAPKLTEAFLEELRKLPGVEVVYPDVGAPIIGVELAGNVFRARTEGLPQEAVTASLEDTLLSGRFWSATAQGDVVVAPSKELVRRGIDPAHVVGTKVAFMRADLLDQYDVTEVPGADNPDGTKGKTRYTYHRPPSLQVIEAEVIGVYDSDKFGYLGDRFMAPMPFARRLLQESGLERINSFGIPVRQGELRGINIKAKSAAHVEAICDFVEKRDFTVFTVLKVLTVIKIVFKLIEVILILFGSIGMAVSFFGIANTMVMAVLERTREIGTLKALGARDRDVRRIFLFEAAGIGAGGGAVGVFVGWTIGLALNGIAAYALSDPKFLGGKSIQVFYVPLWLALGAIGVSTLVAAIAGIYPAWRAARLDPVVALRNE